MQTTIQQIERQLLQWYPEAEARGIVRIVVEYICGWSYTDQVLKRNELLPEQHSKKIAEIMERLQSYEPVQYILGETEFCGLRLQLNSNVLIPRPETEELVQWILDTPMRHISAILDVGTGSGCIALALKKQLLQAKVYGVDISEKALQVAQKNATLNGLEVHFSQADVLHWQDYHWHKYSLIVSNPPYVQQQEKSQMKANVLNFEPAGALFVPEHDPLVFYRAIMMLAKKQLTENGWLFFEINEYLAEETSEMLHHAGFRNIQVKKDLSGKQRMLCCTAGENEAL